MSPAECALAFGGGVVSFLSPCVLPLVPAYLSLTAGTGCGDRRAAVRAGALFAAGFSVVFVLLGLSATALGSLLLQAHVPITRVAGVAVLGLYAAGMAVPFLLAAVAFDRSIAAARAVRRHSTLVLRGSAVVLAGYGLLLALDDLGALTVRLQDGVTALGLGRLVGLG